MAFIAACTAGCAGWTGEVDDVKPMRQQRANQAVAEYEQHRDAAQCQAAESSMRQGDVDTCIDLLDRLLARNPKHREAQLLRINAALEQGEYADARRRAEALVAQSPDDAAALHLAGIASDSLGESGRAAHYFRLALEKEPGNALYQATYSALEPTGEPKAVAAGKLDSRPEHAPAWHRKLLKAELCRALGSRDEALRITNEVLSVDKQNSAARELLDRLEHGEPAAPRLLPQEKSAAGARPRVWRVSFEREVGGARPRAGRSEGAGTSEPDANTDCLQKGLAALDAGSDKRAADLLSKAIVMTPADEKLAVTAAVAALKHDQPLLAAQLAQQALTSLPRSASLYRALGTARYRLGEWPAARDALEQSLALDNAHPLSYFLLGSVLQKLGESEAAQRNFQRAREIDARYAAQP